MSLIRKRESLLHWQELSYWKMHGEEKGKGDLKMKRIKEKVQQVKSSIEIHFHSLKKEKILVFLAWLLHVPFQTPIFPYIMPQTMKACAHIIPNIAVWTLLALSNALMGQLSCSYSLSDDAAENFCVNRNLLPFMLRRTTISAIVNTILNIHANLCWIICLAV